jgi:hypothetical protein
MELAGAAQVAPKRIACRWAITVEFEVAATLAPKAAPLDAFIISQISGGDSWIFDHCSGH